MGSFIGGFGYMSSGSHSSLKSPIDKNEHLAPGAKVTLNFFENIEGTSSTDFIVVLV